MYIHKSTQNAKTTTKPNTSDAPATLFVFKHMCLCTDIRQLNLGVKIIYLLCCTLVYWLFATLGNCFSALDMQNADTRVTERPSFCHRNLQKCSLIIKKAACLAFSEKFQIVDEDDLCPLYILKSNWSLRSTGFLSGNPLMYLT